MNKPVKLGLIGCGAIATREHLPGFRRAGPEQVEIVAFASRTRASAERARALWGAGSVVDSWEEVLSRPDVDAVDIATPPDLHREIAVRAMRAGKHVLVEKPMALSVDGAREMEQAAREYGVVLETAEWPRYNGAMRAGARAIRSGAIGPLTGIEGFLAHGGPQEWAPHARWFFEKPHAGGGVLMDLGVHAIDGVRAVSGEEAAAVAAVISGVVSGVEHEADVLFHLDSGVPGHLRVSWRAPYENVANVVAWGTEGQLVVTASSAVIRRRAGVVEELVPDPSSNLYADFIRACRGEVSVRPSGVDGRAAMAFVTASYRAAAGCAWVTV
jgi:predicted dehydrogenase